MPDPQPKPPPILEYGHHEPAWKAVARVRRAQAEQGWLNVLRYWLWYFGGPTYLGVALAIGVAVSIAMAWVTRGVSIASAAYVGGFVVWITVALRPKRREF